MKIFFLLLYIAVTIAILILIIIAVIKHDINFLIERWGIIFPLFLAWWFLLTKNMKKKDQ